MLALLAPALLHATPLRIAVYNADLARDGPGLLLRDTLKGDDPQINAVADVIGATRPDILLLLGVDYDASLAASRALGTIFAARGVSLPHIFANPPNTGLATGLDMDGDGRRGSPRDAQGYGAFRGQGGMVILSKYLILNDKIQDFSDMIWGDLPGALLPVQGGTPFPSAPALARQRLSSTGHWVVPVALPNGTTLTLLVYHATPPVFDGAEDRNGKRNHDETRFWSLYLDGAFGPPPEGPFVVLGDANLDVTSPEGHTAALRALLDDPRLQDPLPLRPGYGAAARVHGHAGLHTVDWDDPVPGDRRVDYVLPSADLTVLDAAVHWPDQSAATGMASHHHLVWVDVELPQ